MDELVKDFLVESNENLDRLDKELVQLESDASSKELLSSIFRTIHTVKGSCGFLGFAKLEKVAHAGENLLSKLREGKLVLTSDLTSGLLAMVDAIRHMLEAIQATEQDGDSEYRELIELLMRLQQVSAEPPQPQAAAVAKLSPELPASAPSTAELPADKTQAVAAAFQDVNANVLNRSETPKSAVAEVHADSRSASASAETVRVDVSRLDKMMNLVGELVLARNQITQFAGRQTDAAFLTTAQQLNLLTSELQEEVTKTRMQPISNIFDKFPRVVRDMAMGCGKQVQAEMEGKETELDKSLLEAIKDPLTHIVRNSIDHGIERPEQRAAKGKRPEGRLVLRAWHEGGQVIIDFRRWRGHRLRTYQKQGRRARNDHSAAGRAHERKGSSESRFPRRSFHGGESEQSFGPWRWYGRRQDEHREGEWNRRCPKHCGARHYDQVKDSVNACHRAGADYSKRRHEVRHSAGELAGTGAS
jgi:two-component system chemotaxis sensor kinase CheA